MPILLWVVYPFAIWTACFGTPAPDDKREQK
jgi:hypothetical protein